MNGILVGVIGYRWNFCSDGCYEPVLVNPCEGARKPRISRLNNALLLLCNLELGTKPSIKGRLAHKRHQIGLRSPFWRPVKYEGLCLGLKLANLWIIPKTALYSLEVQV